MCTRDSCPKGEYLDKNTNPAICKDCISPCKECISKDTCTACAKRHNLKNGECIYSIFPFGEGVVVILCAVVGLIACICMCIAFFAGGFKSICKDSIRKKKKSSSRDSLLNGETQENKKSPLEGAGSFLA